MGAVASACQAHRFRRAFTTLELNAACRDLHVERHVRRNRSAPQVMALWVREDGRREAETGVEGIGDVVGGG